MLKPGFLDLPSPTSSVPPDTGDAYGTGLALSNEHHQAIIKFHDISQKPYINKVIENPPRTLRINSKAADGVGTLFHSNVTVENSTVTDVSENFLDDPSASEINVNSSSGLVTPPILSGDTNKRTLPDNVGALIASRLKAEDQSDGRMTNSENSLDSAVSNAHINGIKQPPPEFPPQFGLPSPTPQIPSEPMTLALKTEDMGKSPDSLHHDLSTPTPLAPLHLRNSPEKSLDHDTPSTVSPPASLPVIALPPSASKRDAESVATSPLCDDAEYAAAARAAVDSVVCALVGNKTPSTTASFDPALVGTGTDRLYSLSLAPIGKAEPVIVTAPMCSHSLLLASAAQASAEGLASLTCPTCATNVPVKQLVARQRSIEEAKHVCDACGRSFVREDKLKRHIMSIHTMEKPHVCQICTKAFSRKDKLKDHLRHHDRAARTFECSQCLSPFVQKSDLNRHVRGVHQGEPGVGINMTVRRRVPGSSPPSRPSKKKKSSMGAIAASSDAQSAVTTTVSHSVGKTAETALALRLFGGAGLSTTTATTVPTVHPTVATVPQNQAAAQQLHPHQVLAAASMVLPYYPAHGGHHQFVAAALTASPQKPTPEAVANPALQAQQQTAQPPAPSMMLLTRIAAHATNQTAPAIAVVASTAASATPTTQCEATIATTVGSGQQAEHQQQQQQQHQLVAQSQLPQQHYQHSHISYHQYHQHLLHQQAAAAQLQAQQYAAADLHYRQQQLVAQHRAYQQAGFLLANHPAAAAAAAAGGAFFCQTSTTAATEAGAGNGAGVILSAADPTTAQQLAQLAAAAHMQQAVAAGNGLQVMANVIAGQQHQQIAAHQQAVGASPQQMGHNPNAALYASYHHSHHTHHQTVQQQQQQQYHQQAQHQLMLHHANAAAACRPVVMTAAAAAAAAAATASSQKTISTPSIVVQDPSGYQQQLAAFCQQHQHQGLVLAYHQQQQQQQQQQAMQQAVAAATVGTISSSVDHR
uniref:Protein krueppel n=1 Tax=Mesocestoides corti TaxID=53468 RepID=A0A5K3ER11_MESCO